MPEVSGMLISDKSALTHGSNLEHDPLPHPITHIRLLEVLPLFDDEDVRCRLKCVRLTDFDQCYTALSYTWSHDDDERNIFVNGREVGIRSTLHEFLCLYRQKLMLHTLPTVFLWIDALCLNYNDIRERNSQVQIMPNIYQRAKTVLAWLGPQSHLNEVPPKRADFIKFVGFLKEVKKDLERSQNFHNNRYLGSRYFCSSSTSLASDFTAEWEIMLSLSRHHYWSRLWVVQENRFAQDLMFMHEDVLWSWEDFRAPFVLLWCATEVQLIDLCHPSAQKLTQVLKSPAAEIVKARLVFEPIDKLRARSNPRYTDCATERWQLLSVRDPLSALLQSHNRRKCTEKLDKVYALIGLSDSALTIDYDRSNIELFCAVLLSLKTSLELDFVSMLAHHLGVSAFQYHQNRRSLIYGVPSHLPDQATGDIVGRSCETVFAIKSIPARTELSDVMQARLGLQKLNYYRIMGQQNISRMKDWSDFPPTAEDMPRVHGHKPGTNMPVVDGFDLSDTSFRAAMFLRSSSHGRSSASFGMISTNFVHSGDILVTEENMFSGLIVRISGLSKTWLTVVGVVLFARKVTVASEFSYPLGSSSPTATIRSATLSDFCERTMPTAFTIAGCEGNESFLLKPDNVQLQNLLSRPGTSSGRHSRASSDNTIRTARKRASDLSIRTKTPDPRRLTSKSDRMERFLDVICPVLERHSK